MDYKKIPGDDLARVAEIANSQGWRIFKALFEEEYQKTLQTQINNTVIKGVDDAIVFSRMQGKLEGFKQAFTFMEQLYNQSVNK